MVGSEDCECSVTRLKTKEMATAKYLVRSILSIQQALQKGGLCNVYWLPGADNPADGLTKVFADTGIWAVSSGFSAAF